MEDQDRLQSPLGQLQQDRNKSGKYGVKNPFCLDYLKCASSCGHNAMQDMQGSSLTMLIRQTLSQQKPNQTNHLCSMILLLFPLYSALDTRSKFVVQLQASKTKTVSVSQSQLPAA